jgi:hypothetical protein
LAGRPDEAVSQIPQEIASASLPAHVAYLIISKQAGKKRWLRNDESKY